MTSLIIGNFKITEISPTELKITTMMPQNFLPNGITLSTNSTGVIQLSGHKNMAFTIVKQVEKAVLQIFEVDED